ncbi:MAG TPA: hypothetical protein PLR88_08575 [Bacteroidales bacterium]|nr:hypothetical protein [Bacteroidales bacterium]HPT21983.1 hypothetical protein [Bacteroidales bacterium]
MKPKTTLLIAAIAVLVSGCLVKSLHPFYKENDVVFDPAIVGTWLDNDSSKWVIEQSEMKKFLGESKPQNSYKISYYEKNEASVFETHLFKLNNQLYVDFIPSGVSVPELTGYHLVPTHSIAKVSITNGEINLKWFNETWLASLFEKNKIRISHETLPDENGDDTYVLTASTEELQKFIIKYGNDPAAFKDNSDKEKPLDQREDIMCVTLKRIN